MFLDSLQAIIEDPEGHQIIADVAKNDDGSANVSYTPIVGGAHTVVVKRGEGFDFFKTDIIVLYILIYCLINDILF